MNQWKIYKKDTMKQKLKGRELITAHRLKVNTILVARAKPKDKIRFAKWFAKTIPLYEQEFAKNISTPKTIEDMPRTSMPKKSSLRLEMETSVISVNTPLRESVKQMPVRSLLDNMHPSFRPYFETRLEQEGISKWSI
jgi:hypothetical protein